jgi:hypothetical protein
MAFLRASAICSLNASAIGIGMVGGPPKLYLRDFERPV